ncbi:hypothetical protein AMJ39_06565 [candidate division TA06 bacterium DG_24]|uniref:Uncharacterized protein n=3 Tax=Bacteria division TA06 TaxID=1156500 RepID=A0A0S8JM97_UNCT6|nr:MAG: hypothetical protein AMJ39_06565 [candidate division TA06 bacterium DG_24]KPK68610.1 MAG: hypothetical protein AMJ82_07800 [candidate division TA06 bacterium SM23_40]KPL10865.1 MAG: hypothetical protein AMJ71_01675 [candidate division TA06 bacterium SM1_40]
MHIDSYRFGRIVIDGRPFTADVIVYPDRVQGSWWRKEGHSLDMGDLEDVFDAAPQVLIVGTGANGIMRVPPEVASAIEVRGIKLIVERTDRACELFNEMSQGQMVVAALHLTC